VPNIRDVADWIGSGAGKQEPAMVFEVWKAPAEIILRAHWLLVWWRLSSVQVNTARRGHSKEDFNERFSVRKAPGLQVVFYPTAVFCR
jgi:hypothetical protein